MSEELNCPKCGDKTTRAMLITDQTHAACGVFQENQRKEIEKLKEELRHILNTLASIRLKMART